MTINMVHQAMHKAKSDVAAASERLADERARADRRVTGLLGSGWTGVAADSFVDTWDDWKLAADQVVDGLDAMRQLLDVVHRDLTEQDEAAQVALDQISQRILDRLG
jgi:WXG100 family type VII secretion target